MARANTRAMKNGQKVLLELTVKEYRQLMDDLEELEAIRAYDAAKDSGEAPIPLQQALRQIERSRK
jgi:hypothetical protein